MIRIGYPCINTTLKCSSGRTFRLRNYSEEKLIASVTHNLDCLLEILKFNLRNKIFHFRITSGLVPFASHPVCTFNWQEYFRKDFLEIGTFIKENKMRVSMHPDQFVLINSIDENIFKNSILELKYHADILDLMELDNTAKLQIHVGGVYADKEKSITRFIKRYQLLPEEIRSRLVIENDERHYCVKDCIVISKDTGIPVVFDYFHDSINPCRNTPEESIRSSFRTWIKKTDGFPIADYSSQEPGSKKGRHAESINLEDFRGFYSLIKDLNVDLMLEIKDKEKSVLKVLDYISIL